MNILLAGSFDAAERAQWAQALDPALARVLPAHRLLLPGLNQVVLLIRLPVP